MVEFAYRFRVCFWFKTEDPNVRKIPVKLLLQYIEKVLVESLKSLGEIEFDWVSNWHKIIIVKELDEYAKKIKRKYIQKHLEGKL